MIHLAKLRQITIHAITHNFLYMMKCNGLFYYTASYIKENTCMYELSYLFVNSLVCNMSHLAQYKILISSTFNYVINFCAVVFNFLRIWHSSQSRD